MIRRVAWMIAIALTLRGPAEPRQSAGEVLYNGIRLPSPWPPQPASVPPDPVTPYYLTAPPAVIPIDVGRQLFVDDFLIGQTTLSRTYHTARYHPASPVMKPDQPWETGDPMAMPFSDGVFYDPRDQLFKMWYMAGYIKATALATSKDGLVWEKPDLGVVPGTNVVHNATRDSSTVWIDANATDPARRYALFRSVKGGATVPDAYGMATHYSADGINWSEPPRLTGSCGDRTTVFYNPFRNVWVYSLRHGWSRPRLRRYWETPNLISGPMWTNIGDPPWWCGADSLDLPRADLQVNPELYNLDCVAYESIVLGLFTIWYGQPATRPKINEIQLGYSRDGWSWTRPDRRAFAGVSDNPADWNWGNVTSSAGGCLVMGDELWFYVSGRKGTPERVDSNGSTGIAVIRRDGFASMDAGETEGSLTTRTVRFSGKHLFVNVDAPAGELRVEVLNPAGEVVAPFAKSACVPVAGNGTLREVTWTSAADLSAVANQDVRLRFHVRSGRLYSFWVSASRSGASNGYVAGGGPAFSGPVDTVGGGAPSSPAAAATGAGGSSDDDSTCGCGSVPTSGHGWIALLALTLSGGALCRRPRPGSRRHPPPLP